MSPKEHRRREGVPFVGSHVYCLHCNTYSTSDILYKSVLQVLRDKKHKVGNIRILEPPLIVDNFFCDDEIEHEFSVSFKDEEEFNKLSLFLVGL